MVFLLLALASAAGIWARLGVYGDGAYFVFKIGSTAAPFLTGPFRAEVQLLTQWPTVALVRAGDVSPGTLVRLHTFMLVALPAVAWGIALWLQRRHDAFWPLALAWGSVALNTSLFAQGEYNLAYALVALAASLIYSPAPLRGWRAFLLCAAAVMLIRSYEGMLYFGPALAMLAVHTEREPRTDRRARIIAIILFGVASLLAWLALHDPNNPGHLYSELDPRAVATRAQFVLSALAVLCFIVARQVPGRRASRIATHVGVLVSAALVLPSLWLAPYDYYFLRIAASALLLGLLFVAAIPPVDPARPTHRIPLTLLTVLAVPFVMHCWRFRQFTVDVASSIRGRAGTIPVEQLGIMTSPYYWPWAVSYLGIVLQESPFRVRIHPQRGITWLPPGANHIPPTWPIR